MGGVRLSHCAYNQNFAGSGPNPSGIFIYSLGPLARPKSPPGVPNKWPNPMFHSLLRVYVSKEGGQDGICRKKGFHGTCAVPVMSIFII